MKRSALHEAAETVALIAGTRGVAMSPALRTRKPAANALWLEFLAARDGVMSLAPHESLQPRCFSV